MKLMVFIIQLPLIKNILILVFIYEEKKVKKSLH